MTDSSAHAPYDEKGLRQPVVDDENPWPGLDAYDESGKKYFKGRYDVARDLVRLVVQEDLVLLYGMSGLGKTSLLRAGLFPQLPPNFLPVYLRLDYVAHDESSTTGAPRLVTSTDLVSQVVMAAQKVAGGRNVEPPTRVPQLDRGMWEYFRRADDGFWGPGGLLMTPVLVFDQFEELFTRLESPLAAQRRFEQFLRDLAHLVSGRAPQWYEETYGTDDNLQRPGYTRQSGVCKVILSFREDYLANVKGLSRIVPSIDRIFLRLEPMTRKVAARAVCEAGGHLIEGGRSTSTLRTSVRIVRKVTGARGRLAPTDTVDPALLSLFCRELNEKRKASSSRLIDRALVNSAEASRIIATFYNNAMNSVAAVTREFVEDNLVLPGTRSRWPAAEQTALDAGVPEDDLRTLAGQRILHRDASGRVARIELTHDVLVDVVLEARARRLDQAKLDAERRKLEAEAELSKQRLAEEVIRAERQRKKAFRYGVLAAVSALFLFVTIVAVIAIWHLEREQRARTWADAAYNEVGQDARLSTIFALRAVAESAQAGSPMPLAEVALNSALRSPHLQAFLTLERPPSSVVVSENGEYVALVSDSQPVELRKGPDFSKPIGVGQNRDVFAVRFNATSDELFIIYADTAVDRVDLQLPVPEAQPVAPAVGDGRLVLEATVSADGSRVMVSSTRPEELYPGELYPQIGKKSRFVVWLSVFERGSNGWQQPVVAPDGSTFVLAGNATAYGMVREDGLLSLLTAQGRRVQRRLGNRIELSADGSRALAVQQGQGSVSLVVWAVPEEKVWTTTLPSDITAARFSADGTTVAVAHTTGVVSAWDIRSVRALFKVPVTAQGFVFSEDSEDLLTWDGSSTVEVWSARSGQRRDRLGRHEDTVTGAAVASRGASVLTIAGRGLYIWSRPLVDRLFHTKQTGEPIALSLSPDGKIVATAADRSVQTYDVESRALVDSMSLSAAPTALAFSPDGNKIAVGTERGEVIIRTLRTPAASDVQMPRLPGAISAVAFGTSPTRLAFAVQIDAMSSTVVLRDLSSHAELLNQRVRGVVLTIAVDGSSRVAVGLHQPPGYLAAGAAASDGARTVLHIVDSKGGSPAYDSASSPLRTVQPPLQEPPRTPVPRETDTPPPPTFAASDAVVEGSTHDAGSDCQRGSAGISGDLALGATVTSCERVVTRWRGLSAPIQLKLERAVSRVAVSPDGNYMAVALNDGAVWMYHTELPSRPMIAQAMGPEVIGLAFNAGSTRLAALRSDRTLAIYPFGAQELQAIAQRLVGQQKPTSQQCERVFGEPTMCEDVRSWELVARRMMPWSAGW